MGLVGRYADLRAEARSLQECSEALHLTRRRGHPSEPMNNRVHTLAVRCGDAITVMRVAPGLSVREALDCTALRVRAACGGTGSCGACTVRLLAGRVNALTTAEYLKLAVEERSQGLRLACQLRLEGDAEIELEFPAPPSVWKSIAVEDLWPIDLRLPDLTQHIYGVAVDLGTTHVRVSLWDRKRGVRLASRRGPNPQQAFGADVLNRLAAARNTVHSMELAKLARDAVVDAVRDMLGRDLGEVTPLLAEIGRVVIAGNTAMLALLTGRGGEALLDPENWQRSVDCQPADVPAWRRDWHMPNARIEVLPAVAGFVGSDLLADLVATRLADGPPGSMLLDVGTNAEIALWDGHKIHVTSVPGGPAFEGGGVRHGMPAEPGAISAVRASADGQRVELEVIGGAEAKGFCGSGLLDAMAVLLQRGVLKSSGRFAVPPGPAGYLLDPRNSHTAITGNTVDAFQRAKAATAAAMAVLLEQAGMNWGQITRLCVCGAFGDQLNIVNAQALGLLPPVSASVVELYAEATLGGCEWILLSDPFEHSVIQLARSLTIINVTLVIWYEDRYIEELRLRPIAAAG